MQSKQGVGEVFANSVRLWDVYVCVLLYVCAQFRAETARNLTSSKEKSQRKKQEHK